MKTALFLAISTLLMLAPAERKPRSIFGPPAEPLPTTIALVVKTPAGETRSGVAARQDEPASRPVASVSARQTPQVRWMVKNVDRVGTVRSVVIHFLITRQDRVGAPIPDGPRQGSVVDQVLGTDLPAGKSVTGNYNTPIEEPGAYLVEVELLDEQGNRRQYCALDLQVK